MATTSKVIVTNQKGLTKLYGTNVSKISAALNTLIGADQRRGITTQIVFMDNAKQMGKLGAPVVTNIADDQQNKDAVDGVYTALTPDYLMILGGPDVVPHQTLTNPVSGDPDANVPSDLPYACAAAYSTTITDFLAPTRVVGRLAGITGSNDTAQLVAAINTSASLTALPQNEYTTYLAVSAEVWQGSTTTSVSKIFGSATTLQLSPPDGPNWTSQQLAARSWFVNCHGSDADPNWYGQKGSSYPKAVESAQIQGNLSAGTIATAECCYGAELYASGSGTMPICNAMTSGGVAAFCGSTNIAYGPASGQGAADLITQDFLKQLLGGRSAGSAMLLARQDFISQNNPLGSVDQKTIAQFILLSDPAAHPVQAAKAVEAHALDVVDEEALEAARRSADRIRMTARGEALASEAGFAIAQADAAPEGAVAEGIERLVASLGLEVTARDTAIVEGGPSFALAHSMIAEQHRFHSTYGTIGSPGDLFQDAAVLLVEERDGVIVSVRTLYRK